MSCRVVAPASVDLVLVVAVVAGASLISSKFVDAIGGRWWLPLVPALVVGIAALLLAPVPDRADVQSPSALLAPPVVPLMAPPSAPASRAPAPSTLDDATTVRRPSKRPSQAERNSVPGVRIVHLPKLGSAPEENEDAFAVAQNRRRVAVADGASSAFASRQWSRLLVDSYVYDGADVSSASNRSRFITDQASHWQSMTMNDGNWWNNDAQERGSFAAFIGVEVGDSGEWSATSVGDCCVFVFDRKLGNVVTAFPLDSADQFGSTPDLIATNSGEAPWQFSQGILRRSHLLILASDAVSEWLLTDPRRFVWLATTDESDWAAAFDTARSDRSMVNDDVTLVVVVDDEPSKVETGPPLR